MARSMPGPSRRRRRRAGNRERSTIPCVFCGSPNAIAMSGVCRRSRRWRRGARAASPLQTCMIFSRSLRSSPIRRDARPSALRSGGSISETCAGTADASPRTGNGGDQMAISFKTKADRAEWARLAFILALALATFAFLQTPTGKGSFLAAPDRAMVDLAYAWRKNQVSASVDPVTYIRVSDTTLASYWRSVDGRLLFPDAGDSDSRRSQLASTQTGTPRKLVSDLVDLTRERAGAKHARAVFLDIDVGWETGDEAGEQALSATLAAMGGGSGRAAAGDRARDCAGGCPGAPRLRLRVVPVAARALRPDCLRRAEHCLCDGSAARRQFRHHP